MYGLFSLCGDTGMPAYETGVSGGRSALFLPCFCRREELFSSSVASLVRAGASVLGSTPAVPPLD